MNDSIFEMKNVTKRFRDVTALDDVSFQGTAGKVIALLGENGAGKTTAINVMLGMLKPDSGTSSVLGMNSQTHGLEIRKMVGYVPDKLAYYDWMNVDELGWFASGFYAAGYHERYKSIMTNFHVPLDKKVKTLSKGMQAKVSLALSLAHEPKLLILDEPTSGLDPLVRREFLESMVDVAAQNRTVLLSSHQISEVERVADIVVIMIKGKFVMHAPLEELKNSACDVVLTGESISVSHDAIPGRVVHQETSGHQQQLMILDVDQRELAAHFDQQAEFTYEFRQSSLEEILLRLLKTSRDEEVKQNV